MSLNCSKIILGGDLNLFLGLTEIWGDKARRDCLYDFFGKLLDDHGFVDIMPSVILPNWNNRSVGNENIRKHLDRLLISVDLLQFDLCFHQWVGCGEDLRSSTCFFAKFGS